MAVPRGTRFEVEHDQVFAEGAAIVGPVSADMEYVSNEDKARGKQPKQRIDEQSGLLQWKSHCFRSVSREGPREVDQLDDAGQGAARSAGDRDCWFRFSASVLRRSNYRAAGDGREVQVLGLGVSGDRDARTEWSR
jgi:hypothetical protein